MPLKNGEIYQATITGIKKFGGFVCLPTGENGMVHISEIQNAFVEDINSMLSIGQTVKVKLISTGADGRLAFSIKQAQPPGGAKKPQLKGVIWQGKKPQPTDNLSFEDMLSRFKTQSEEKLSDYKKSRDVKKGGYYKK